MSAVAVESLPEGQREALDTLHSIARASDGALMVDLDYELRRGVLYVRVYLSSASLRSSQDGAPLEAREPIDIQIAHNFPDQSPVASTGRDDFPRLPHQPWGSRFCVRVEKTDWDPAMGMRGFLRAVIDAYQHVALGTLEGHLQAWRPIVAFDGKGWAVIRADLESDGHPEPEASFRWAVAVPVGEDRIDIVSWLAARDDGSAAADLTEIVAREFAPVKDARPDAFLVPAVTVAKPIALEYSDTWVGLLHKLQAHGVDRGRLLGHVARATAVNQDAADGQERALALFRVAEDTEIQAATSPEPTAANRDGRFAITSLTQHGAEILSSYYAVAQPGLLEELLAAQVKAPWVRVYDGRPGAIRSRAARRPTEKLTGKKILLLGGGGLGAPIAEHCIRSGAASLRIVDSGTVSPGILSRQPYEDADIGKHKADILATRLSRIYPGNEITGAVGDVTLSDIFSVVSSNDYDLVIDATANRAVATMIERSQRDERARIEQSQPDERTRWPALITVAINQQATHGVAAVTPRGAVGAGVDLLRRLGLSTCTSAALDDVHAAFFPPRAGRRNFRPDTSCSDTTFIGSTTDTSALAAQLLDSALTRLETLDDARDAEPAHRSLTIIRLGRDDELRAARVVLDVPPDRKETDHRQVYEVRVDENAMETMREHVRASANGRTPGAGHTGGLLLGQFDSACRIAWVSQATGLPPGSTAGRLRMTLGLRAVQEVLDDRRNSSEGRLTLIGFWHTHPGGSAEPSEVDRATMRERVASPEWPAAPALLLVLGIPENGSVGEPPAPWEPQIHAETFMR